jgi:cGMP-dependent protein kinase 2
VSASFRVAIVGSGPAGLSAAARAAKLGLSHILLEKTDHLSDTIYKYQLGKHVMSEPSKLDLRSDLRFRADKREVVLDTWKQMAAEGRIHVRYKAEIVSITGKQGEFTLSLAGGDSVTAETVVLAIGTQGNPRLVDCPVAEGATVQYQLDDPAEYLDEPIVVIGAGDAGIENALGLAEDPEQNNQVMVINRSEDFATAKNANVEALLAAEREGRIIVRRQTKASTIDRETITLDTRDGVLTVPCKRVIARMGSLPPREFVMSCCAEFDEAVDRNGRPVRRVRPGTGIAFTSEDKLSFPQLSQYFETTVPGVYVVGALAGYPLIKQCMNQGHDVVEYINGNTSLEPIDEATLQARFAGLPGPRPVSAWLDFLRENVAIFAGVSPLQMREFMLDSEVRFYPAGKVVFERGKPGSSLFAIASGSVVVEISPKDASITVPIGAGSIFGEVGLISGRPRGATVRTVEDSIIVEVPRTAALKLMATVPSAKAAITHISTERQLLQMFRSGLKPEDVAEVLETKEIREVKANETIINEGEEGTDIFVIRRGSMVVEKNVAGKPVFLSYLPAGSYVGEMALIGGGRRTATVRAAIKSEVIRLDGSAFKRLLDSKPELLRTARAEMARRQDLNNFIESKKESFSSVVDMYSEVARFLVKDGIGDATDVLLIDEKLCVGCDNCERACADSHEGLSRLDREAGKTFAHLHVPTSCRHCEHPHCMADCPPNAIHRGDDGEVYIDETCIGCGNCQRNCPYGVIRMEQVPPRKPGLLTWLLAGLGPGPGEPSRKWIKARVAEDVPKKAIKCDMCSGIAGGPACVRACPTGAAIRVAPEEFLTVARLDRET